MTQAQSLVLSLFPGIGLFGKAFEAAGHAVVRGPDLLWGGDVRTFSPPPRRFDGLIGGPPCQAHSTARFVGPGTTKEDLIPEFVRIWQAGQFQWVVMENVPGAAGHASIPREWHAVLLRDWDCGGETHRKRMFWTWPFRVEPPPTRPGEPALSVMATTYKRGSSKSGFCQAKGYLPGDLPLERYAELQGFDISHLQAAGWSRRQIIHGLGNGVPRALGDWIVTALHRWDVRPSWAAA
jgi:DNA (cytosine-5)-methyltransferase 1